MEPSLDSIKALAKQIKEDIFSKLDDVDSFVSPSAYDTAWVAMIPDTQRGDKPMFPSCLDWIVNNQHEGGSWGECDANGLPTIDTLPATLACMIALRRWNAGDKIIKKGLNFIQAHSETLLRMDYHDLPRWFAIVFPEMVELGKREGLELVFPVESDGAVSKIFMKRQEILEREELVDKLQYHPPLLSYLEALPSTYDIDQQTIHRHLGEDGSLFQSPSATARAYMTTLNPKCLEYLTSIVQRCHDAVPALYPVDEELVKLSMVDQVQRLVLAEHFTEEIEGILSQFYRAHGNEESQSQKYNTLPVKIYKDSLAFRLLRMQGYNVTPERFFGFLNEEHIVAHIEQNYQNFISAMYSVYRATDLTFPGEPELDMARTFSKHLLEKAMALEHTDDLVFIFPSLRKMIAHEINYPWITRLDHLDQRMWIEENIKDSPLWIGKASFSRLSCLHDGKVMQLAVDNFHLLQSIYRNELEELMGWNKAFGFKEMGFRRARKGMQCYLLAYAFTTPLAHNSYFTRMINAKSAILVTIVDDYFATLGRPWNELQRFIDAANRWDDKDLSGAGLAVFRAISGTVTEAANEYFRQTGTDMGKYAWRVWNTTFISYIREKTWLKTGYIPAIDEYLEFLVPNFGINDMIVPAMFFWNPIVPSNPNLMHPRYETITKLCSVLSSLANDIQSYKKEMEEGSANLVLYHNKLNPGADIEDSIAYVKELIDRLNKEFVQQVLLDGFNDMPKACRQLHLSVAKHAQFVYYNTNLFDPAHHESIDDLTRKAAYIPLECQGLKARKPLPSSSSSSDSRELIKCSMVKRRISRPYVSKLASSSSCVKVITPLKFNTCLI